MSPILLQEMKGTCVIFLIAGYETTSTLLGFFAYEMALNPDIQAKLTKEIDEHLPEKVCYFQYGSTSINCLYYITLIIRYIELK